MHMSVYSYARFRSVSKHLRQTSGCVPLFIKRMNAFDHVAPMKMEMKNSKKMKVDEILMVKMKKEGRSEWQKLHIKNALN